MNIEFKSNELVSGSGFNVRYKAFKGEHSLEADIKRLSCHCHHF